MKMKHTQNPLTNKNPDDKMKMKKKILSIDAQGRVKSIDMPLNLEHKKGNSWKSLEYSGIGYVLVVPLILGVVAGLGLDRLFGTRFFVIVGIIFGTVSSFYNLWKIVKDNG